MTKEQEIEALKKQIKTLEREKGLLEDFIRGVAKNINLMLLKQ